MTFGGALGKVVAGRGLMLYIAKPLPSPSRREESHNAVASYYPTIHQPR
jgi:hypothetical protein